MNHVNLAAGLCRQVRPLHLLCVLVLVSVMAALISTGAALALSIELKDAAPDRVERQRAAAAGRLPLPSTPDVSKTAERMAAKGFSKGAPVLIRIFKAESELELWMERDGRFEHFATYPICHWSGTLGPKLREGDRQTPEGFYTITSRQLHRLGRWPRALNLGFPNAYDQALNRGGSYILVHGGCSSVGCFAMTNPVISEIYDLASAALRGGQRYIHTHVFPFRMTDENLQTKRSSAWADFWSNLKDGYDSFERTRLPPRISVCDGRYHIQDSAPVEAGASRPLAVCGPTAAALSGLSRSGSLVPIDPASPMPGPDNSSAEVAAPALPSAVKEVSGGMYEFVPNLDAAQVRPRRGAGQAPPVRCNLARASCRKFVAPKSGNRHRLAEAPRSRRAR